MDCSCNDSLLILRFVSTQLTIPERLAIGKHNLIQPANRVAGFGWINVNGDDVARLRRIPVPAKKTDRRRTARFSGPMYDVAFVVFHVKLQNGMGIGPQEFRDRGIFQDNDLVRVSRSSVVCEQRAATDRT
jgi:hypothetical protein